MLDKLWTELCVFHSFKNTIYNSVPWQSKTNSAIFINHAHGHNLFTYYRYSLVAGGGEVAHWQSILSVDRDVLGISNLWPCEAGWGRGAEEETVS